MNKKFIVFLSDSITGGGAELSFRKIVEPYLSDVNDCRLCIIILDKSRLFERWKNSPRLWFFHQGLVLTGLSKVLLVFWSLAIPFLVLYNSLLGYQPCVVSFQTRSNFIAILSKLISFNSLPVLISERIDVDSYLSFHPLGRYYSFLIRSLYNLADIIVCNSSDSSLSLSRFLKVSQSRIVTVLNGYDFRAIKRDSLLKPSVDFPQVNKPIFVTVGRLEIQKCHEFILRSLEAYRDKYHQPFMWVIVGDGSQRQYLENLVMETHMHEFVCFLGHIENPLPYIRMSDIFLFASLAEGFPNALAEAVILNKPIVTNRFKAGLSDVLGTYPQAIVCTENIVESYAKSIHFMINRINTTVTSSSYSPSYNYKQMVSEFSSLIDKLYE